MRRWAALVLLFVSAACSNGPAAPPSKPLLVLKPCTITFDLPAECGTLSVPEDRAREGGRLIGVQVTVLRGATSGSAVFLLAGGPGQASSRMAAAANGWLGPLRGSMDIVLVDQRGTEDGNLLACPKDVERDPAGAFGHVFYLDVLQACRAGLAGKLDATKYTTEDAVADLDDVRQQLSYEQVSLYGVSYGTRLAQAYIRRHPDRVRSGVLDGVLPMDINGLLSMARSMQLALERVVYPNRKASAAFESLLERFDRGPIGATVRPGDGRPAQVRMSRQDFLYSVRGILYQDTAAEQLPGWLLSAARTGNIDVFAQRYWQRARFMQMNLAHGVHLSVDCAEETPFASEADIERETAGTVMGRWLFDEYANACRIWPSVPVAAELRAPVSASVPVLLVSGAFDPVTPPEFGERVAKSLPRSRHIVVRDGAHGSAGGCPLPAVLHVLKEGTLDRLPDVCR